MRRLPFTSVLAACVAVSISLGAAAHDEQAQRSEGCVVLDKVVVGDLEIAQPWARATRPGQANAAGYVTITNRGAESDRLVHASSPRAARTEIHTMEIVNDIMTMRPVEGGLDLPAGETVELRPGGLHVMLIGVAAPLTEDEMVPVRVEFEKAGPAELTFVVQAAGHGRGEHDHSAHAGHDEEVAAAGDCLPGEQSGHHHH